MFKLAIIAFGGAIGAVLRYIISGFIHQQWKAIFPIGTLIVNLSGSFLIGFLWGAFEYSTVSGSVRALVFIGILGGYTTFSSFCLENLNLFRDGEAAQAWANILLSNIGGIALVFAGFFISKFITELAR